MDIGLATRVYRQLGDAGMVMGLERILPFEDKNLLAGHVLLLFQDYNAAQDLFLSSSQPQHALEMRRDLLHWDQALKLATTLDPAAVPEISTQYAQQLEFKGEYEAALSTFEQARRSGADAAAARRVESKSNYGDEEEDEEMTRTEKVCLAGVARCTLRLGDLRRGIAFVRDAKDKLLCRDCAAILEGMNQHSEAAALYEDAEHYEKAAAIYVKKLNFAQAAAIMPKVTLPKLHAQYGKACEAAGKFQDAVKAYEDAHDMDAVVRLYLGPLNRPEKGFEIVRRTTSSDGAQLVARFCQDQGDFRGTRSRAGESVLVVSRPAGGGATPISPRGRRRDPYPASRPITPRGGAATPSAPPATPSSPAPRRRREPVHIGAIEFLLMAKRSDEAFELAKLHGQVETYTGVLGEDIQADDALNVAQHYETVHEPGLAGKYYALCGQSPRPSENLARRSRRCDMPPRGRRQQSNAAKVIANGLRLLKFGLRQVPESVEALHPVRREGSP